MTAGLPMSTRACWPALLLLILFAGAALAQDGTVTPTLEELAALNILASPEQIQNLIDLFTTAVDGEFVDSDQAMELLIASDWTALGDGPAIDAMLITLDAVLTGLADGELTWEEALAALEDASGTSMAPDGFVQAITQAGASEATVALAQSLVAAGVPPGIVVRIVKQSLNQGGLLDADVQVLLATLGELADGDSWGKLVNEITEHGSYKHQDREKNKNQNDGASGDPEEETERNEHGKGSGKDKKG